jgi:hypothetical protein
MKMEEEKPPPLLAPPMTGEPEGGDAGAGSELMVGGNSLSIFVMRTAHAAELPPMTSRMTIMRKIVA